MGLLAKFVLLIPPANELADPGALNATGPTADVKVGSAAVVATMPLVKLNSGAATTTGARAAELIAPLFVDPYDART